MLYKRKAYSSRDRMLKNVLLPYNWETILSQATYSIQLKR